MYTLTLTKEERKAIDWVGYRYSHGDELRNVLTSCDMSGEWDDAGDITFTMPEHKAWEARDLITTDALECFAPTLSKKLLTFSDGIV